MLCVNFTLDVRRYVCKIVSTMRVAVCIVCSCLVALVVGEERVSAEGIPFSGGDKSGGTEGQVESESCFCEVSVGGKGAESERVLTSFFPMYLVARAADGGKVSFHDVLMLAKMAKCGHVHVEGGSDDPTLMAEREKEAARERIELQPAPKGCKRIQLKEGTTAQEVIRAAQLALYREEPGIEVEIALDDEGKPAEQGVQVIRRVAHWLSANATACQGSANGVELGLPDGWWAIVSNNEDTFLFPPPLQPEKAVILKIPAHLIDTVRPEVLGQPKAKIRIRRIEEPGEDEPRAFMELTIPVAVWEQAVEGLPVVRLINAQ